MSEDVKFIESIELKPEVEVDYGIPEELYYREIYLCNNCNVYFNYHELISLDSFYQGQYNNSITKDGLLNRFNKIISFPKEKSDNFHRVQRIINYIEDSNEIGNVLDVGSGTCVFLYELKKYIPSVYCIDPDLNAVKHAINVLGVNRAWQGSLSDIDTKLKFDIITFNKVLEHVNDPVSLLIETHKLLNPKGFVYIELPEADRIVEQNQINKRAEFAVEHLTVFNQKSLNYLADISGFYVKESKSICEPSGKFTIYGFLHKINPQ
jgi:2-polyprenyl-3-methyl-5-hydroxy-6-metoxy-1,4-benzoquinol methylase